MERLSKPHNAAENGKIDVPESAEMQAGRGLKNVARLPSRGMQAPAGLCVAMRFFA